MNGYNFTERVRKVLAMSREEAVRLRHEYVGTEHMLLGLLREPDGVAITVLQSFSVGLEDLSQKVEESIERSRSADASRTDLPYTSRAKKVLELAMSEARELHHSYVGTEHLLLGLLREEKGIAAQVLNAAGVTLDAARAETLRLLGTERGDEQSEKEERVRQRFFAWLRPDSSSPGPAPRAVAIELRHADGWTLRKEFRTTAEAIEFLRAQQ
jgi:ATP-dependent Clp protease ATP-binding subunit ClpC